MFAQQSSPNDYLAFQVDLNSEEAVSNYDELPLWAAAFGLMLLDHVPLRPNIKVLDVGCGTGFPLLELAQRLGPSCTVIGLDTWEAALERARFKARVSGVRNVEITKGDAAAMCFPDAQFDLIVSNLGLNNFSDPKTAVGECRRVMKPRARLALTTNLQGHMKEFYDVFDSTLRSLGETDAVEALQKHIDHRATVPRIRALLEQTGLRVTKVHEASSSMRFLDGSSLFRQYFIKFGFLGAWKDIVNPRQQEDIFSRLEANLNQWAESRGELVMTIPMAYVEAEKPE